MNSIFISDIIRQKNIEIENLKMEMKAALEDLDAKTHKIEKEIDRNKETLLLKEAEIQELNAKLNEQSKQMTTHGALKVVINLRELKKTGKTIFSWLGGRRIIIQIFLQELK